MESFWRSKQYAHRIVQPATASEVAARFQRNIGHH
jgi:hypothetical protein